MTMQKANSLFGRSYVLVEHISIRVILLWDVGRLGAETLHKNKCLTTMLQGAELFAEVKLVRYTGIIGLSVPHDKARSSCI